MLSKTRICVLALLCARSPLALGAIMRCYFLRNGHIAAVEVVTASSNEDGVEQGQALFEECYDRFDGFEVWDEGRCIHRSPASPVGSQPM